MNVEQAKDLMQMQIWEALVREVDFLISFEEKKLRSCSAEQLQLIQSKIAVYESIKSLPQNVIDRGDRDAK